MSAETIEAGHRIGRAIDALDTINAGNGTWKTLGLVVGHMLHAVNDLLKAVENLERKDEREGTQN